MNPWFFKGRAAGTAAWLPLAAAAFGILISVLTWRALLEEQRDAARRTASAELATAVQIVGGRLDEILEALRRVARRWERLGGREKPEFDLEAEVLLESYPSFRAVGWVGPDMRIRWIFPEAGNEAAAGLKVDAEPMRAAAFSRARSQGAAFTPPVRFVQGGIGVVGVVSIGNGDAWRGFTHAAVDLGVLFRRVLRGVVKENALTITADGVPALALGEPGGATVHETFDLGGVVWRVSLGVPTPDPFLQHLVLALGVALSTMLGLALRGRLVAGASAVEARAAAGALASSEAQHRAIIGTAAEAIVVIDGGGRIRSFNPAAERLFGYPEAEAVGRDVSLLIPDGRARSPGEYLEQYVRKAGRRVSGIGPEFEGRRKDGSIFPFELSIAQWSAAGERHYTALMRDVTERKRAEAALRESERRFRVLAETIPQIVWTAGPDGALDYLNPRWSEFTGQPMPAGRGWSWGPFVHPDDREATTSAWRAVLDSVSEYRMEHRLRAADGSYRWVRTRAAPLLDADGRVRMWVGTALDVHDEYEASRRLRERTEALEELGRTLDLAPVLVRGLDDRVVYWNRGTATLYGWSPDEAVGRTSHELLATRFPDGLETAREAVLASGSWRGKLRHRCKNGSEVVVESLWALHRGPDGTPRSIIEVNTDVTDRERAEEEVRELNRTLEARVERRTQQLADANTELQSFAHTVAHDLRAPLRSMTGFSQALLEDYGEALDETAQDYLQRIAGGAGRMDQLIQDLLSYAKISREEIMLSAVPLERVVADALGHLEAVIRDGGAELSVESPLPSVVAHRGVLVHVVVNLLSNAVKFVPAGRRPRIVVRADRQGGRVRLWVEDNGIGVAAEHQGRIFQVFQRLHGASEYPGTGIGLAIVRRGTERMGGEAGIESAPGRGSRFWIELMEADDGG
ncbi:PAS domain S-box protein [Arenibaculum sp.]|uniref:PAS domain S-box protein n=1 Tax=Arenibaculum sp. TaxID=2865862 RepID=UPI002E142A41|nr:PAS domain S-box protein [Arenibaculum sp.]